MHERDGVAVPILPGWRVIEVRGAQLLVGRAGKGFAENVMVLQEQDLLHRGLSGYLAQSVEAIKKNPNHRLLHTEVTKLQGRSVGVIEIEAKVDQDLIRIITLVVPRPGRFVVVTLAFLAEGYETRKPELAAFLRGLRFAP